MNQLKAQIFLCGVILGLWIGIFCAKLYKKYKKKR